MARKLFIAVLVGVSMAAAGQKAQAQHLDLSALVNANLNADQQFFKWAWQRSVELGRQIPPGQLPFNAMTLSQANRDAANAWGGYNAQWHANQARLGQTFNNLSDANRGLGYYHNPHSGQLHQLPWTHNNYHMTPNGYIYPGRVHPHYGQNLNPFHGW